MYRVVALVITVVVFLSQVPLTRVDAAEKVALLVGVNHYEKRGLRDLEFAERDVTELSAVLGSAGFKIELLTAAGTDDRKATLTNIRAALERVVQNRTKDDLVLVGLAGHGFQIEVPGDDGRLQSDSFYCPTDAERGNPQTMLSIGLLLEELDRRGGGKNLLLVDACREDPTRGRGLDGSTVKTLPEGVAVLFGCGAGQKTFETKAAGGGHGVFFHYVIEGLKGGARNEAGEISWSRLSEFVSERVEVNVATLLNDHQLRQIPYEIKNLPGRSPILVLMDVTEKLHPARAIAPFDETTARRRQIDWAGHLKSTPIRTNKLGMKLTLIPPGEFKMGLPGDRVKPQPGNQNLFGILPFLSAQNREKPQHAVRITKPYYLGLTEVTQGEWTAVMGSAPWRGMEFVKEGDLYPAVHVNWNEATEFCRKLSTKEGSIYRLPTEAEWEHACRAGTTTPHSYGSDETHFGDFAWYEQNANGVNEQYAHPVAQKLPNPWGLYDMAGNVYEWCNDRYGDDYYVESPLEDPQGPFSGTARVFRGGSWQDSFSTCSSTDRRRDEPTRRDNFLGFRVVLVP